MITGGCIVNISPPRSTSNSANIEKPLHQATPLPTQARCHNSLDAGAKPRICQQLQPHALNPSELKYAVERQGGWAGPRKTGRQLLVRLTCLAAAHHVCKSRPLSWPATAGHLSLAIHASIKCRPSPCNGTRPKPMALLDSGKLKVALATVFWNSGLSRVNS